MSGSKDSSILEAMLDDYGKVQSERESIAPTFLEIAGYAHHENIYSNILAYCLDPEKGYSFQNIFAQSLFCLLGLPQPQSIMEIHREALTDQRNRIDIIVETETHVIGIENKIFARIFNDLKHYKEYLKKKAGKKKSQLVLLHLFHADVLEMQYPEEIEDFDRKIRHMEFLNEIQKRIKSEDMENSKDMSYFNEYKKTIENLGRKNEMPAYSIDFFMNRGSDILMLYNDLAEFRGALRSRICSLNALLKEKGKFYRDTAEPEYGIYDCLYFDLKTSGNIDVAIDCHIRPDGWEIMFFSRNEQSRKTSAEEVYDLLKKHGIRCEPYRKRAKEYFSGRYSYVPSDDEDFSFGASESDLAKIVDRIISQLKD